MEEKEAILFYKKLTRETNDDAVKILINALGCLPLAIAQAAGYVNHTKGYLERFY